MTTPFASASFPSNPTVPASAPAGYTTPTTPPSPDVSPPIDAAQLESMRGNILELVLREVAQAILGAFVPGAESAFDQIAAWAQNIPLLGPLVEALTGAIDGGLNELEAWATGIPSTVVDHVALNPGKFFAEAMQVTGITGLWLSIEPFLNKELGWAAVWDDIANFISGILGITNNPTGVATGSITHSAGEALKAAVLPSATAAANAAATGAQAVATIANADPAALTDAVKTAASSAGPLAANVASGLASHPAVKAVTDAVTSALSDGSVPAAASNITSNLLAGPAAAVKSLADAADALAPAKGITGEVFSVAQNVLGLADNPSGSSSGSIVSLIASVLGSGVLSSGDVVSNIASTLTQALTDAAAGSLSQANADITSRFGTTSLGQLLSEILGAFTNPGGSSHGSLLQSIWWSIWSFINCNGLTGRGFTAGNNITGALDNPTGSSLGSLVGYVTDLVQRLFGNGGAFLTELVKTLQDLSSGNILGLISDFFTFGPALSAVMRDVSAIANFFSSPTQPTWTNTSSGQQSPASAAVSALLGLFGLGSGSGGLAEVFTTFLNDFMGIFGNPNGLGTGSPGLKSPDQIPVVAPTHNLLQEFFGGFAAYLGGGSPGTSTNGPLNGLFRVLEQIPLVGGLVDSIVGVVDQLPIIGTILQLLGIAPSSPSGGSTTTTTSSGGTTAAAPLTLAQLIGLVGTDTQISPSQLSALAPSTSNNVLADSTFQTGASIQGQGLWCWDGWFGSGDFGTPGGSIRTIRPGRIVIYNIVGTSQSIYMWGNEPVGQAGVGILLEYARANLDGWLGNALLWALTNTDPSYFEWINVPYPAAAYPMGPSVQAGHDWLVNQINQTPGPFFFVMDSQGNQVGASVYDELRFGSLKSRNNDFLGALALGNLRREEGHYFPGCPDLAPGTSGMCGSPANPKVGNLVDTEDRWWDFAVPGDYFACTPIEGATVDPGPDAIGGNVGDIPGVSGYLLREFYNFVNYNNTSASIILNWLTWTAQNGIFSGIDIIAGFLGAPMQVINALGGSDSPHQSYYKDTRPLAPRGDTRTFLEIGTDYLNSFVGGVHPDGTRISPPPVNGVRHQMLGQRIAAKPGDVVVAGAQAMWVNIDCPTDAIIVGVNAYDSAGNLLAEIGGSDVTPGATITNPEPSSNWAWVTLEAEFVLPEQTASACLLLDVEPLAMETGIVWFTNCKFEQTNLVDGALINIATLEKLSGEQVSGPQGEANLATAIQNYFAQIASAQNQTNLTGLSISQSVQQIAQLAYLAVQANDLGVQNHQILSNPSTKPLYNGLQPTGDATFQLTSFQPGSTLNTIDIPEGTSIFGFINCTGNEKRGFIKFIATSSGAVETYINVYEVDQATGDLTSLYSTGDISSEIPNGFDGYVGINLPGADQIDVTVGQWIAIEIVANGSPITVMGEQWGFPNDSATVLANLSATRTVSTKGISPASLAKSDISFGNTLPWILFAVSSAPPTFQPPNQTPFLASGTYTIPSWVQSGDYLDMVLVGDGGAGGFAAGAANGQGAQAGAWAAQTFTYGTDIPAGITNLDVLVGDGGCAPSGSGTGTLVGYGFSGTPQFDAVGAGASGITTQLTCSHTATEGAYVIVGISTSYTTFAVQYGDKTMTSLGMAYFNNVNTDGALQLFALPDAPGGTTTITVTFPTSAFATINSISFTNVLSAVGVTNAYGTGSALAQQVDCESGQLILHAFGNQGFGQLDSFSGGIHSYYGYEFVASHPWWSDGLSFSYATESTSFTAECSVNDNWGSLAVVLNPPGTILLSAAGGQPGAPAGNNNPSNPQTSWSGAGPGNENFGGRLYVGGSTTAAAHFPGNPPGGGSSAGDASFGPENGAPGQAWITARQAAVTTGTANQNPVTAEFRNHGTFSYSVPSWAKYLDFILVGAGGSGYPGYYLSAPTYYTGDGGIPGSWTTATVSTASGWPAGGVITVTVGQGGAEQGVDGAPANPGGNSSVSAPGMSTYTATGGSGDNTNIHEGVGPGDQSYGGVTYRGAETAPINSDGNSPGGAGAGGTANASVYFFGGAGGDGAVWIVARAS